MSEPLTLERAVEAMARVYFTHRWDGAFKWDDLSDPGRAPFLDVSRAALAALVKEAGLEPADCRTVAAWIDAPDEDDIGRSAAALLRVLAEAA